MYVSCRGDGYITQVWLKLNILSTRLVLFDFTFLQMYTVMMYNPRRRQVFLLSLIPLKASSVHHLGVFLASVTSGLFINDLNLHPDFCITAV